MSRALDYFPPKGTRWQWSTKALNYSSWTCNVARQREPQLTLWPMDVIAWVDVREDDGRFLWGVNVIDWTHGRRTFRGDETDALRACRAAEACAELAIDELLPDWIRTALTNKWRPPCGEVR